MASAGVSALGAAGAFTGVPVIGWGVGIAAAVLDAYVLMPALQGKGRGAAKAPRLLDSPVGSNEAGAPRVWAIGIRVRVPTHILWQDEKVRETNAGNNKAGTAVSQRRVYFDALIALNDRETVRLVQLIGSGKLVLYDTRNLLTIRSASMIVSVDAGQIVLTMTSTADPDFSGLLAAGDAVELRGFVVTAGANLNAGYWKVDTVTGHTSTPSIVRLDPYSGQTVAGTTATAGTVFSPATIKRVDDVAFSEGNSTTLLTGGIVNLDVDGHLAADEIFEPWNEVSLSGFTINGVAIPTSWTWRVLLFPTSTSIRLALINATATAGSTIAGGSATNAATIRFASQPLFTTGLFPAGFNPAAYFHNGADDQDPDELLEQAKSPDDVPAYRGVACQGLDDFFATMFGDQLPYSLEALIDVDPSMTWAQAFATILRERCAIPDLAIDVDDVNSRPFQGYYLRGAVPAVTTLQPLLLAGQVVGQERDGTIALFDIENADRVEIRNDAVETHFGTRLDGEQPEDNKWTIEDQAAEDLPTSVGVRHQDPDNGYADGYQFYGLRNPAGVEHQNEQEVDLSSLVLTRKEAANLAATVLRRAWINRRTYRFVLTAQYLDLLENDLLEWTDDDGRSHVARVIQRDIGSDLRVSVTCIAEDPDLAMFGVPTQSAAGDAPRRLVGPAALDVVVIDAPAIRDDETKVPGLKIAVGAVEGSVWAGASLYESLDGSSWQLAAQVGEQAIIGALTGTLAETTASEVYGSSTVTFHEVDITAQFTTLGADRLDEATRDEAVAGKNWCALVDPDGTVEIAAFTVASAEGDGVYTLGTWLRGLRGTEPVGHFAGTKIVMLSPDGANVVHRQYPGQLRQSIAYRIVPAGLTVDDVDSIQVVAQWRNCLPLPVRSVTKTIGGSPFDARFTVAAQWTRAVLPPGTQPPHAMDEPVEAYRFTIYDPTGTIVRRTVDIAADRTGSGSLRDRWVDYDAADQTLDGYTPSGAETFWIDVQQVGAFGVGPSILREL